MLFNNSFNLYDFGGYILPKTLENAVVIERHNNRYYYDTNTVYFDNLLGGYIDGRDLVPVRFGLKHSRSGNTALYVVVDQNKISIDNLTVSKKDRGRKDVSPELTESNNLHRSVNYSISQIFTFVNSKDLLRYIPDDFLNADQKNAKHQEVSKTEEYTNDKNNRKYSGHVERGYCNKNIVLAILMCIHAACALISLNLTSKYNSTA